MTIRWKWQAACLSKAADYTTLLAVEIYQAPRSWAEQSYHKLIYFNEVEKGSHFAAWEEPQLFSEELRAALKSLR